MARRRTYGKHAGLVAQDTGRRYYRPLPLLFTYYRFLLPSSYLPFPISPFLTLACANMCMASMPCPCLLKPPFSLCAVYAARRPAGCSFLGKEKKADGAWRSEHCAMQGLDKTVYVPALFSSPASSTPTFSSLLALSQLLPACASACLPAFLLYHSAFPRVLHHAGAASTTPLPTYLAWCLSLMSPLNTPPSYYFPPPLPSPCLPLLPLSPYPLLYYLPPSLLLSCLPRLFYTCFYFPIFKHYLAFCFSFPCETCQDMLPAAAFCFTVLGWLVR